LEPARVRNHGHIVLEDLYHKKVRIPNRFKELIWKENRVEMRIQIVVDVVPISVALVPSLLHQNHIGVAYARTSNFKMEPLRFVPLYSVAMP
jgi:hypothetical protein